MNPLIDQILFTQTNVDSSSLTMHSAILHQFTETGSYRGVVSRAGAVEATFTLVVDAASAASQADIDLASLKDRVQGDSCCGGPASATFTVSPKGYAVFHVSQGSGGYAVHLGKVDAGPQPKAFDTRELRSGDLFTANLLRPGTYAASAKGEKAHCEITVSYPQPGKTPYPPPSPVRVEYGSKGFKPTHVHLLPTQGMIFEICHSGSLKVELQAADDGPRKLVPTRGKSKK